MTDWIPNIIFSKCWKIFCKKNYWKMKKNFEEKEVGSCGFNRMGLKVTQPKIHSTWRRMFPSHLVILRGDVRWLASPDLSICNFFLLGHLKEKVFKHYPQTIPELREWIIQEVNIVTHNMFEWAVQNFRKCLQQCVAANSCHLKDIIFKT